jgi:hypothetical protein
MKFSIQTKRVFPAISLAAILFSVLCFSCEPRYWQDYVMSQPEPIEELTVTDVRTFMGGISISCTYVVPSFSIVSLTGDENDCPDGYFFIRKEGAAADEEILVGRMWLDVYDAGDTVSEDGGFYASQNDVEKGESYVLVGYTVDQEGQLSEPAVSEPFVVPLYDVQSE